MKDKEDFSDLGCAILIATVIICITAYEIAKLFVVKGVTP